MCGIAGIVSYAPPPNRDDLVRMTRAIAHRGPDDEGFHLDGPCALGFRRLAIIDLATGHQPMTADRATVVFNGEIYNFRELKADLEGRGQTFATTSDTEVLLHAYLQWGSGFAERIDGMFAFALWDRVAQKLICGRDRFGKKPFYYADTDGLFLFASELKALIQHPACPREVDPGALRRYLAFEYVPTPHAIFRGVKKLREGHVLVVDRVGVREERFFQLRAPTRGRRCSVEEATEEVRLRLRTAVKKRLVSDVPLGVFLSGGIDSTGIVAMAAPEVPRLRTFAIGFEEASFDESRYARLAAETFGTDHVEERLTAATCLDLIPKAADQLDEPFADPSYLPTHLLSRFTRKHVTVALGGDGGDELFAGYDTFLADPFAAAYQAMPELMHRTLRTAASHLPTGSRNMSLDFRIKTFLAGARFPERYRHQAWIGSFTPETMERLLAPAWRAEPDWAKDVYADIDALAAECPARGLDWALRYYLSLYLKDDILVKVDRASMATSLEVRAPYLDTALVEFVLALPAQLKMRRFQRKWLLKRALRGLVPDEILDRKKKGFGLPLTEWLRGPLRPMLEDVLGEASVRQAGFFEPTEVRRLLDEHVAGRADHRKPLWTLMMFELWRRRWLSLRKSD